MGQTDFFGTFLDTLQSSTVERSPNAFGRSVPSSAPKSALTTQKGASVLSPRGGVAAPGADAIDPTDAVFRELAKLDKVGGLPVDLKVLLPVGGSSLKLLMNVISGLEEFGLVERTEDGRIALTGAGHRLVGSIL